MSLSGCGGQPVGPVVLWIICGLAREPLVLSKEQSCTRLYRRLGAHEQHTNRLRVILQYKRCGRLRCCAGLQGCVCVSTPVSYTHGCLWMMRICSSGPEAEVATSS
jgi:hypothetical protein